MLDVTNELKELITGNLKYLDSLTDIAPNLEIPLVFISPSLAISSDLDVLADPDYSTFLRLLLSYVYIEEDYLIKDGKEVYDILDNSYIGVIESHFEDFIYFYGYDDKSKYEELKKSDEFMDHLLINDVYCLKIKFTFITKYTSTVKSFLESIIYTIFMNLFNVYVDLIDFKINQNDGSVSIWYYSTGYINDSFDDYDLPVESEDLFKKILKDEAY